MSKILITASVLFLTLSAVFGVLNTNKARELRSTAQRSSIMAAEADQVRITKEKEMKARDAAATARVAETEGKIASAESDLIKTQSEKTQLQARVQQSENEIADLQRRLEEAGPKPLMPDALPMPGSGDLQAQLEETRHQLDSAEREKQMLADRIRTADQATTPGGGPQQRRAATARPGVRGTVLAVNHSYGFVVLNLGGRQGVEANTEMLVLRGGTAIGRLRVSSVEPATAIGDIISSSLPRGVQVQPGDTVIYAGS